MLKRWEIRNQFGLKGNEVEDCLVSSCCAFCAIIQQEKEVVVRQRTYTGRQGPSETANMGYQRPPNMATPPP